eukprot:TRINITY_DN4101_c0_g1_i6.p1 TRINITY_DN4101_c0_g1~~TRINITY_DN4101_c0_g1_i6.p1  ORF type:complete len:148 (-),score=7.82 TRINITY_DN4101_c0_g1_i6:42-485(-)
MAIELSDGTRILPPNCIHRDPSKLTRFYDLPSREFLKTYYSYWLRASLDESQASLVGDDVLQQICEFTHDGFAYGDLIDFRRGDDWLKDWVVAKVIMVAAPGYVQVQFPSKNSTGPTKIERAWASYETAPLHSYTKPSPDCHCGKCC